MNKKLLLIVLVMAFSLVSLPVFAESGSGDVSSDNSTSNSEDSSNSSTNADSNTAEDNSTNSSSNKENAKEKVAEVKAKAQAKKCETRQKVVNKITARIADRAQKQLTLFSNIADKVEAFYTKSGKTLTNYNDLVTAVNTAKANAQQTVDTIKTTTIALKCDGTDPNGAGASFKDELKNEIHALKDLRTAVKNLTVGVKSVQSTGQSDTSSNSAGGNN